MTDYKCSSFADIVTQESLAVDCTDSIGRTPLHHAGISDASLLKDIQHNSSFKAFINIYTMLTLTLPVVTSRSGQRLFVLHWDSVGL